jgi:cytochrome b561
MEIKNTENRYGVMAILLHWGMAMLVIGMLALGLYMTNLPLGLKKIKLIGWHKEFGILILMLVCFRFGWRVSGIVPRLPSEIPQWQKIAARLSHFALYFFMFAMPLTGWMMSSAANFSVSFFGWFTLPQVISPNPDLKTLLGEIHKWFAYGLIATICIHIGAALKHHFINKDNVLIGMLP